MSTVAIGVDVIVVVYDVAAASKDEHAPTKIPAQKPAFAPLIAPLQSAFATFPILKGWMGMIGGSSSIKTSSFELRSIIGEYSVEWILLI